MEKLHRRFVVVTINNTSNNCTFTSKKLYTTKLLAEVGLNSDALKKDYSKVPISKKVIITTNFTNCEKCDIHVHNKTFHYMLAS